MSLIIKLIPVAAILALLFMRKHMLLAGLVGGIIAMIIGRIDIGTASGMFIDGVANMLSITIPILYAAAAVMVSEAGSISSLVELAKRGLRGNVSILAGIVVLIQGFATYMAGMGAGNTMVTAPLIAVAVGAIPEVIAGMAIVSAVGFTTSPASTETALAAESAGADVVAHAIAMRPYTVLFYILGAALAIYGVYRKGALIEDKEDAREEESDDVSSGTLLKRSLPSIALLLMVVAGSSINDAIGINLISPATTIIFTAALTVLLTPLDSSETSEALIDGSRFILTTLFGVGMFLAFINMIAEIGTFEELAAIANRVPEGIVLPTAMVLAFLIAIPSGAFAAGVLTLTLPTLSALGLPSEAMGFVAIAVGLGTQVSPVQINVIALGKGFETDVMDVIRANLRYIIGALILVIIIATIVV
ncbi:MAG TPA: hypothetical protein GXX70_07600 [Tepidimicrobium sp.]|nr:hypothetical protein [Tepidimicrobium sp.]